MHLQPLLHDLLVVAQAPTQAWSGADGQVHATGLHGAYHADVRVLSRAELTVGGAPPEPISAGVDPAGVVHVVSLLRAVDAPGSDPTARLDRARSVRPGVVTERLEFTCSTPAPVRARVELRLAADLASMEEVKAGLRREPALARLVPTGLTWVTDGPVRATVEAAGADIDLNDPAAPRLAWDVEIRTGEPVTLEWRIVAVDVEAVVGPPASATPEWSAPQITADDRRLPALVERSLADLATLRMSAAFAPADTFLAAGAPWFFTLFGRDSIWAARMLLPLGTELAGGTLRTLAARQGSRSDPATAEQPGKILHEVRRGELRLEAEGLVLPPVYYGTVDATPLWVCLLHDAWRWGLPAGEVRALLPQLEAALEWMAAYGDEDGDGFLEYADTTGHGLANQGWKDSGDAVQWRDGTLATGPIALAEVQGYAHEAAIGGAALLEAFGRPGAARWREWAAELAVRFRAAFWTHDDDGPYPGIALDANKRLVDTVTSNIGHLLGTGLLDEAEELAVAQRLCSAAMDSGYGLRTLSTDSAGYWPLRYHGGAVWPHDTAIAIAGLARSGQSGAAAGLLEGLLAAAPDFDYRFPELFSGDARGTVPAAVPYPAACRPQAWAAAAGVAVLAACLGLEPDVPAGVLRVAPLQPCPVGALAVTGLRLAGRPLAVAIAADGAVQAVDIDAATSVRLVIGAHGAPLGSIL